MQSTSIDIFFFFFLKNPELIQILFRKPDQHKTFRLFIYIQKFFFKLIKKYIKTYFVNKYFCVCVRSPIFKYVRFFFFASQNVFGPDEIDQHHQGIVSAENDM